MTQTRTTRQLAVLAILTVIAIVLWTRDGSDLPAGATAPSSNQRAGDAGGAGDVVVVPDVRLEQLTASGPAMATSGRDPFRFRPAPPPPPPPALPPPAPFDEPSASFAPQPLPPPRAEPIPLQYEGVFRTPGEAGELIGVFVGVPPGLGRPFLAKAGDVIDGRYRVLRVGPDSAEVARLDGSGRQTIRMSGQ